MGFKIFSINTIVLVVFFFYFTHLLTAEIISETEWIDQQYKKINLYYHKFPDDFVGIGVYGDKNIVQSENAAKLLALQELSTSISARISSLSNYLSTQSITKKGLNSFSSIIKQETNIIIRGEQYVKIGSFYKKGKYFSAFLVRKNKDKYFEELPTLKIINDNQNGNILSYIKTLNSSWKSMASKIEKKWGLFEDSNREQWVIYDKKLDSKTTVNFVKGFVVIDVIMPKFFINQKEMAIKLISNRINQIQKDKYITCCIPKDAQFDISQNIEFLQKNKYSFGLKMKKNYIEKLTKEYLPFVKSYCHLYELEPSLILAIIHTESNFNPYAKSIKGALGLMQIIPKYAGKDSALLLYGDKEKINDINLFDPQKNILIGTTYLHILMKKEFKHLPYSARRNCSIAAYNWGPYNLKQKIKNCEIDVISGSESLTFLLKVIPDETKKYLDLVLSRVSLYH